MEAYEVEDAQCVGDSRVTIRTIAEYKKRHGIDARTFIDNTKLSKTHPVLRSWVEHVRLRHPEASELLDRVPHNGDWYTLPGDAASKSEPIFKEKGKTAARAQRRAEHTIVETEGKLMTEYIDLCKQKSNLLGDEAYYSAASQVGVKAILVTELIRTIRHNWTAEHKARVHTFFITVTPTISSLTTLAATLMCYTIGRGICR